MISYDVALGPAPPSGIQHPSGSHQSLMPIWFLEAQKEYRVSLYNAVIAGVAHNLCDTCLVRYEAIVKARDYETHVFPIDWISMKAEYQSALS